MATMAQAAAHIYCSRAQFDQYLAEGVVTRQPSGQYELDEVRRETFAHLRSVAAGRGGAAGDRLTAERVALTAAKRRIAERQDQIEAGQVARVEPIVRFLQGSLLAMRDRLLNLPGELAFVVAGRDQVEVFEAIDAGVREALEEISNPDFPARAALKMTKSTTRPTWRNDYPWGFRVADGGRIEPLTKPEAEAAVARGINRVLKKVFGRRAMAAARRRLAKRGGS